MGNVFCYGMKKQVKSVSIRLSFIMFLVLAGCAADELKIIDLGSVNIDYEDPFTMKDYAYFVHGFYLDRNFSIKDGKYNYRAVWDIRKLKKSISSEYQVDQRFKKRFPAFVEHKGNTACNQPGYALTKYNEKMEVISTKQVKAKSEALEALCMVKSISEYQK